MDGQTMTWAAQTLREVLFRNARERGAAEALVTDQVRLSYSELAEEALAVAAGMQALGLARGDHVGILMGNDAAWIELFYGAAILGCVTVPVNTRFKAAELAYCLQQADCKALFYLPRFLNIDYAAMVAEVRPQLPKLVHAVNIDQGLPKAEPVTALGLDVQPDDPLLIQFTSGTTAYPKGVVLTHDNMLRNAWAAGTRFGIRPDDRYFNCRPFFHVGGSTLSALASLVAGACLVTLPTFEAGAVLRMLEAERCTLTSGNDTIFQMLMGHADFDPGKLHLRGGWAAAGPQTMRRIIDVMGAKEICAAYGLSEASPNVVMSDWRDPEALRVEGLAKTHEGMEIRIQEGEIQVRGWSVMKGYYNDPEQTAKAFTGDGWLRTGDLGTITADGRLRMVGRLKDVFRVGGENVAPAEVEEVLLAHPAVQTAQVVGVPDARLGEVGCAYVTLKDAQQATEAELTDWAKERCANFRVPRYLRIVESFDAIGMTASGKVQKNKLREHALQEFGLG
jgi:fatty-acyl-CoA synthase